MKIYKNVKTGELDTYNSWLARKNVGCIIDIENLVKINDPSLAQILEANWITDEDFDRLGVIKKDKENDQFLVIMKRWGGHDNYLVSTLSRNHCKFEM